MSYVIRAFDSAGTIGWVTSTNDRGSRQIGNRLIAEVFDQQKTATKVAAKMPKTIIGMRIQYSVEIVDEPAPP